MLAKKIVVIGAGSLAFTPRFVADLILSDEMSGSTISFVDLDSERLELMTRLANKMIKAKKANLEIESTTDRREVLKGAGFVISTIAVGGIDAHNLDVEISKKYGIYTSIGDTVGPQGFSRALRQIPATVDVCRDMESLCPNALFINEANPLSGICSAVHRATKIKVIGLGSSRVREHLAQLVAANPEQTEVVLTGINHLVWILAFRVKGEDAYPSLIKRLSQFGPVRSKLFEIYGIIPAIADEHVAEFYSFFFTEASGFGKKYGLSVYPGDTIYGPRWREEALKRIDKWLGPGDHFEELLRPDVGEKSYALDIIETISSGRTKLYDTINIPNEGSVTNLPQGAILETSTLVGSLGIRGIYVGELPTGVAATLYSRILQQELTVDAALSGDRKLALQALLADPMISSIEVAEGLLADLLEANSKYLPQFQ